MVLTLSRCLRFMHSHGMLPGLCSALSVEAFKELRLIVMPRRVDYCCGHRRRARAARLGSCGVQSVEAG